jgi:ribosomal protein S18 acetylase RimI-like enzyme
MTLEEKILIREATLKERPAIADLIHLAYSEFGGSNKTDSWIDYESRSRDTILHDNSLLRIIAEFQNEIVGAVLFCPPYQKVLGSTLVKNIYPEMRLLAVPAEHRNLGVGAKLINECENKAKNEGFAAITLHTTILMQTAKLMYERRGYSRYPAIDFEPTPGFTVWGYIKELNNKLEQHA